MVGGGVWEKTLATMVDRRRKIKKKHWLKRPKAVLQKWNLYQNINYSKSHICNFIFWKYYFGRTTLVHTFQWTSSAFFIPEFVAENLKAYKNQRKISLILQYSFAQKTTLILRISTLLKLKIKCSQNTAIKLSQFTNFQQTCFCLV